jgi:hypothetical protein
MDHTSDHLSRGPLHRGPSHALRRFVSILTLLAGLAASLLTMPQPLALAHALTPAGHDLASEVSSCHLAYVSDQKGPITRFDIFQGPQNPIGTLTMQVFYCDAYGETYYQSTFARFTYHQRSIPLPSPAPSLIEGRCILQHIVSNISSSSFTTDCILQDNTPIDTPIIAGGPGLQWTPKWMTGMSNVQCVKDDSPTASTPNPSSLCITPSITFSLDSPSGSSDIPCDKYPLLDPLIKPIETSNKVPFPDGKLLTAEVLGYYDSTGTTYCRYLSARATIQAPAQTTGWQGMIEIACTDFCGNGQNKSFSYPDGRSNGYTDSYYTDPVPMTRGYACAALNPVSCEVSTALVSG